MSKNGANYLVRVGADTKGLHEELGNATADVRDFGKAASDTAKDVETNIDSQVRALGSSANYKRELRGLTMEILNLTMVYKNMTDQERNSPLGQAIAEQLTLAKDRAAELTDQMGDLKQEIRNMASDTAIFDGVKQGLEVVRDGMMAFATITGAAGGDMAEFEKTMADVLKVFTSFNALISITNALQSQSAMMTAIHTIQMKAGTIATNMNTAAKAANATATTGLTLATVKATAAQAALNVVARANPYVLLATALMAVGGAMYYLFQKSRDATAEMKKQKQEAEALKKAQEKLTQRNVQMAQAGNDVVVQMKKLSTEYSLLKTKAEKQRWIEENKDKFSALGFEIESVKDAEDIFVNNTGAVVAALVARAKATQLVQEANEKLNELDKKKATAKHLYEKGSEISKTGEIYHPFKRGQELSDEEAKKAGVRTKSERKTSYTDEESGRTLSHYDDLTDAEIKKVNDYRNKVAVATKKAYQKSYEAEKKAILDGVADAVKAQYEADKKLYSIAKKPKLKTTGSKSKKSKEEEKAEVGSLEDLQKQREKLEKIQQKGTYKKHKTNADEVAAEIKRLDKLIADEQFTLDFNTDPAKVSLEAIEKKYDEVYTKARSQKLEGQELKDTGNDLKLLNQVDVNRRFSIGLDIKPAEDSLLALQHKADEVFNKMQNPSITGTADFSALQKEYQELQEKITGKKMEMEIDTKPAEGSVDDLQAKVVALLGERNELSLNMDTDEAKAKVAQLNEQIQDLLNQMNGQASVLQLNTEPAHASIAAMEQRVSDLKKQLNMDVSLDIEGQKKIVDEIKKVEAEIKKHKITIGLETDPSAEELKTLAKQTQDILKNASKKTKTSSFEQAVPKEKPGTKSEQYDEQLHQIEQLMNANDTLMDALEEQKAKYEEIGQTGVDEYQKIVDKLKELKQEQGDLGDQAKAVDKQQKSTKKLYKNWSLAADAIGDFGGAMSTLGSSFEDPTLNIAGVIAQGIANIILGASQAIAQASSLGPFGWIAVGAMIMAEMASMVAQVNSISGSYATGGIIPGSSFSGDKLTAKVNSGEMILNSSQLAQLWQLANGVGVAQHGSLAGGEVEFVLRGDMLRGVLKNTNRGLKRRGRNTDL